jgi:ATP-dependent helicase/nuclease subunit B
MALEGRGWIGFEVITPRPLALRVARPSMEADDVTLLDAFDERALLDEAMDHALAREGSRFAALADGVGFRERVHGAVLALRLAGMGAKDLERSRAIDAAKRRFLRQMVGRYEESLVARRRVDTADVLRRALAALEAEGARLPSSLDFDLVLLLPGLGTRGLTGRLLAALAARGAKVVETDAVLGVEAPRRMLWKPSKTPGPRSRLHDPQPDDEGSEAPATELFRASSIDEELREVLRRVMAKGLRWDQVEIVTPDPAAYGSALHALAERLAIPVGFAVGLPIERTRTGRVVRTYLDWIAEGFHADPIRRLLEAGDLRPRAAEHRHHSGAALARRFRSLRIGWGRMRYRAQINEALQNIEVLTRAKHETEESFLRRRERATSELHALRSILFSTLRTTPSVPDHMGIAGARVSPAEVARGLRAFLRRVPEGVGVEREAREEVDGILERVEATLVRRTAFTSAITVLRRHLDIRVRGGGDASASGEAAPWASEGGHLHLSDFEHGGFAGRGAVFFVGMDVERTSGRHGQDPVLLDGDRRTLGEELPTSSDLLKERAFDFAALYARLRGAVTLSFAAWDASEARTVGPSPLLVQALRLARRDPSLTFADLDRELGRVVCASPAHERTALDRDDAWMAKISHGGVLRIGVDAVSDAYPAMRAGTAARIARAGEPCAHHGVVTPRPERFDPRRDPSLVVSASRLEALGACPLRYLHSTVLGIHPPDDPEFDPDRWLDALRTGSLLHEVYEGTLREAKNRGLSQADPLFEDIAAERLARAIERMRTTTPIPGEGAFQRESLSLANDVRSFVRMVRENPPSWIRLEMRFGLADDEPVAIEVGGGIVRLRGAIDRIDEDLRGLRVIDYKTGVARDFGDKDGAFNGGRRLQLALYTLVAEARLSGMVVSAEYHFPTTRGLNDVKAFDRLKVAGIQGLVEIALDGVAAGSFVPTDEASDCRYCDFSPVCRVRTASFGDMQSPLADWSRERMNAGGPAFVPLKRVREFEG